MCLCYCLFKVKLRVNGGFSFLLCIIFYIDNNI